MTFKQLTELIAEREGLKESLSIAQVKEVTKLVLEVLANTNFTEVAKLLGKYQR